VIKPQVSTGAPPGTRTPNPRIKSPLLCSRIPRHYLRLCARTSEDISLTCSPAYRMMTAATGLYRRIRASTEQAPNPIGLDHLLRKVDGDGARSRPGRWARFVIPAGGARNVPGSRSQAGSAVVGLMVYPRSAASRALRAVMGGIQLAIPSVSCGIDSRAHRWSLAD